MIRSEVGVVLRIFQLHLECSLDLYKVRFRTSLLAQTLCHHIVLLAISCPCFCDLMAQVSQSGISTFSLDEDRYQPSLPAGARFVDNFDGDAIIVRRIVHCDHGETGWRRVVDDTV